MKNRFLLGAMALSASLLVACGPESSSSQDVNPELDWLPADAPTREGYIWNGIQNRVERVRYTVVDGQAIFEGDIILGPVEQVEAFTQQVERRGGLQAQDVRSQGLSVKNWGQLWTKNVVPYDIDPNLPAQDRVVNAIAHWQNQTSHVTFVRRTATNAAQYPDYVVFQPVPNGCYANVGRIGGRQAVNLGGLCSTGNVIHEIGHALGLFHEQTREDYPAYVRINFNNIISGYEHNFAADPANRDDQLEYDYGSIMHYNRTAFSATGGDTITPLGGQSIGQRVGLSRLDVETINLLYPRNGQLPTLRERSLRVVTAGFTNNYMTHSGGLGITRYVDKNSDTQLKQDATFTIVPGLADATCYSFKSINMQNHYLRHSNFRLRMQHSDGTVGFNQDATFCGRPGLLGAGISLESYNYRGYYLRHRNAEVWLDRYENTDIYKKDATWRESSPFWMGSTQPTPGMYKSFQATSPNMTTRHLRHTSSQGFITTVNKTSDLVLRSDATFKIVRGLAYSECISFESRNYPGHYLRHTGFRIRKDPHDFTTEFSHDATFCVRRGLWGGKGVSFESFNYPGYFIRHYNSELWIANGRGSGKDTSTLFNEDSSWWIVPPWAP